MSNLRVWTSLMKRTIQTTSGIDAPKEHWKALNEIDAVSWACELQIPVTAYLHIFSNLFILFCCVCFIFFIMSHPLKYNNKR